MACYSVPGRLDWKTSETMLHRRDVPSRCAWRKSVLHHSIRSPWFATGQEVLAVRGRPGHGCRARIGGSIPCQLLYPPPPPPVIVRCCPPTPTLLHFPHDTGRIHRSPPSRQPIVFTRLAHHGTHGVAQRLPYSYFPHPKCQLFHSRPPFPFLLPLKT